MTQAEQSRSSGLTFLFAFVGGALAGATAALLFAPRSGTETRRRITGAVEDSREVASRVPRAVREASRAAQAAFAAALKEYAGEDSAASVAPGAVPRHHA